MEKRPLRTTRKLSNLQAGRPGWYRLENLAGAPTQVMIYDEIGMLGVSADQFMRELANVAGDIELHMNCPGGDVFDGIAIYNNLRQRNGTVRVIVDGLAASAASFIAQAASPGQLAMAPHSQLMIHDGFGMAIGNAADMRQMAGLLDKASDNIASIYADRTGKPADYWRQQMQAETWYSDQEAVDAGLADSILGQEPVRNTWDLSVYRNAVTDAGMMHGDHARVDPDGDGDCDACPEGDTDHDYWDEDGNQIQPLPGEQQSSNRMTVDIFNSDKYSQADRDRMAKSGEAMPDGSYPVADQEDLDNAIHAVGRGGADHDAIRRHVIKRAKALGHADMIPDNWNADGSLNESPASNLSDESIWAELADPELFQLAAGKE